MPYLDGSNPYLVNYAQVNDFAAAQERSWQVRYDYDFRRWVCLALRSSPGTSTVTISRCQAAMPKARSGSATASSSMRKVARSGRQRAFA